MGLFDILDPLGVTEAVGSAFVPQGRHGSTVETDPFDPVQAQRDMEAQMAWEAQKRAEYAQQQQAQQAATQQRQFTQYSPNYLGELSRGFRPIQQAPASQWGYQQGKGVTWDTAQRRGPNDSGWGNRDWSMKQNTQGSGGFGFGGNRI